MFCSQQRHRESQNQENTASSATRSIAKKKAVGFKLHCNHRMSSVAQSGNLCKVQGTWTRLRVLKAQRIDNSDRVLAVRRSTRRRPHSRMRLKAKLVRLILLQVYIRYQQLQKAQFVRQALKMMSFKQATI